MLQVIAVVYKALSIKINAMSCCTCVGVGKHCRAYLLTLLSSGDTFRPLSMSESTREERRSLASEGDRERQLLTLDLTSAQLVLIGSQTLPLQISVTRASPFMSPWCNIYTSHLNMANCMPMEVCVCKGHKS